MEFQVSLFQGLITFFLVLFMTIRISKARKSAPNLIPGPWKLPLIGNLHQLAGSSLPHRTLRDLANKHGPIMHLQLGQVSTVVVSSPEIAKEIMKTHDLVFAYRPSLVVSMITTYECTNIAFSPLGNYWRQLRKICNEELLSADRVGSFRSIREEEVSNLVETIKTNEGFVVNLSEKVFAMTYAITARAAFGEKCRDQEAFIRTISEETKVHGEADRILGNIVNEHKESRNKDADKEDEDLVDVLLRVQEDGQFPLTDNNIKAIIFDIFSGGSETSATVVDWAMSEMIKNPNVLSKAQAEVREAFQGKGTVDETGIHQLNYLNCVIKETLRLHPVFPLLLPRECIQNCQVNGFSIPSKTRVIINAWAIGRDPHHWSEPEKFDPERFVNSSLEFTGTNFEFIPFGAGRRICPGILFAVPNVELPLAQLLFHFDWKLPSGKKEEEFDMTEAFGLSVRRRNELVLVPSPYQASITVT